MNQILNLPNCLTGARFALAGYLAALLARPQTTGTALTACLVFSLAAASDWLDGYLARRYQKETVFGKLMDPLADKVLVATALIMLLPLGRLPAALALVILCRELIVTGLRGVAATAGIVVAASGLGKVKSTLQYVALGLLIFPDDLWPRLGLARIGLWCLYLAAALTVWSGIDYFVRLRQLFFGRS